MFYGIYNKLVNGVYKPTYNWGAPSCTWWFVFPRDSGYMNADAGLEWFTMGCNDKNGFKSILVD